MPNILKKISTKTAVTTHDFKIITKQTPVLRIFGILRNIEVGEHAQYGRFLKFKGDFQATDLRTGDISVSSVAFLPSPVDEMLEEAFKGGDGASVEFGFDISVNPRPDTAIGYEFVVSSVLESRVSDPMQALLEKASKKALPRPGAEPVLEADTEPAVAHKGKK